MDLSCGRPLSFCVTLCSEYLETWGELSVCLAGPVPWPLCTVRELLFGGGSGPGLGDPQFAVCCSPCDCRKVLLVFLSSHRILQLRPSLILSQCSELVTYFQLDLEGLFLVWNINSYSLHCFDGFRNIGFVMCHLKIICLFQWQCCPALTYNSLTEGRIPPLDN